MLLRRHQLHYFYVASTAKLNPVHFAALTYDFNTMRRKIFDHANSPWEGDNVTLKADLIQFTKDYSSIATLSLGMSDDARLPCLIVFSEDEESEYFRMNAAQVEADEQLQACRDAFGIRPEGWVTPEQYEKIKQRQSKLKADALEVAESDQERLQLCEHWISDDFGKGKQS